MAKALEIVAALMSLAGTFVLFVIFWNITPH
jgi:hypothetical protein